MAHRDGSALHAAIFAYVNLSPKVTSSLSKAMRWMAPASGAGGRVKHRVRARRLPGEVTYSSRLDKSDAHLFVPQVAAKASAARPPQRSAA
jgi:hypothetical protein